METEVKGQSGDSSGEKFALETDMYRPALLYIVCSVPVEACRHIVLIL